MKTLKNLETNIKFGEQVIFKNDLKELTIKWIKEDLEMLGKGFGCLVTEGTDTIERWKKRLNVTEKDLDEA